MAGSELLYFLEFEADLYETSHFAKFSMVTLRMNPVFHFT